MNFDEYENETARTASEKQTITVCALGIAGEAGEVVDHIKKHLEQGHELNAGKLALELGDLLWYMARMAHELGYTLDEIAKMNILKLRKRYPDGFSVERSVNRDADGFKGTASQVVEQIIDQPEIPPWKVKPGF